MTELVIGRPHMIVFIVLFLWGLYIMVTHNHLIRKLIGMYLVQTSVFFLIVTFGTKSGSTVPIIQAAASTISPEAYANPLPHMVVLTAIVVAVATLGVSLALVVAIYRRYHTLDEGEITRRMES